MQAMLFAAGLGTRLYPLTANKPKALVEVGGIPLLELAIKRLIKNGIRDIVINVHHFANQIEDFLQSKNSFGINIQLSDERNLLLETGGGLKAAKHLFRPNQPILIYNVDILSDLDLQQLMQVHMDSQHLATLAVTKRTTSRELLFDHHKTLAGWRNVQSGELKLSKGLLEELQPFAFSGIHIIDYRLLELITEEGVFSIIETYLRLAKSHSLGYFDHTHTHWVDLGKKENILEANELAIKLISDIL